MPITVLRGSTFPHPSCVDTYVYAGEEENGRGGKDSSFSSCQETEEIIVIQRKREGDVRNKNERDGI